MAPSKRKNNQQEKKTASENCRNGKRQCTRSATSTTTVSVKQEPEEETKKEFENDNSVSNPSVTVTVSPISNNNDNAADQIPTTVELSKKLCRIVDMDNYSREEGVAALGNISKWLGTSDTNFLKSFHVLAAGIRVLHFLTAAMNDVIRI